MTHLIDDEEFSIGTNGFRWSLIEYLIGLMVVKGNGDDRRQFVESLLLDLKV